MDPLRIGIRVLFAWIFLLAGTRLSGKRTIAEVTVFDFVLALVLGDMVDDLLWAEVSAAAFSTAVGTLLLLDVAVAILSARVPAVARVLGDSPVAIIRRGRLLRRALRRERLDDEAVAALLRHRGLRREELREVEGGWLDGAGQPAFVMRPGARPADYRQLARLRRELRKR